MLKDMDLTTKISIAVLVVNSIAAGFAVIAAVIAIVAYRKTATLQRRAIDVSLFDLRTEILTEVIHKRFQFERTRAKMLFNDEINDLIKKFDKESAEATRNKRLKEEYIAVVRKRLSDNTFDETVDFLQQIDEYESINPDKTQDDDYERMRESIRNRRLFGKWHYGASPEKMEYVDYISADDEYSRHYQEKEFICEELQEKMRQFIETSIQ